MEPYLYFPLYVVITWTGQNFMFQCRYPVPVPGSQFVPEIFSTVATIAPSVPQSPLLITSDYHGRITSTVHQLPTALSTLTNILLYAALFSNDVLTTEVRWNRLVAECLLVTNIENVCKYQAVVSGCCKYQTVVSIRPL